MENFETWHWSGQGPVFLGERDSNGDAAGLGWIGDVAAVDITPNVSRTNVPENFSGQRNILSSFVGTPEYQIRITMRSVKPTHLARAIGADLTVKAAASATAEVVEGYHDLFSKLANVKVSNVVVKDATDVTTYVAGTDYVLHADEGMIEILSTGSIGDGDTLHVSYDYAAQKKVESNYQNKRSIE